MLDGGHGGEQNRKPWEPADLDALTRRIGAMAAKIDAATAELLEQIRLFDAHEGWGKQGFKTLTHWLVWCLGVDARTAREYGRVARALGELPELAGALARGEISYSKVRAVTRVATPACERELLDLARHMTGAQLDRVIRRYQNVTVEGQGLGLDRDRRRFLEVRRLPSGMVRFVLQIGPEEADALEHAITLAMGPPLKKQPDGTSDPGGSEEPASAGSSPQRLDRGFGAPEPRGSEEPASAGSSHQRLDRGSEEPACCRASGRPLDRGSEEPTSGQSASQPLDHGSGEPGDMAPAASLDQDGDGGDLGEPNDWQPRPQWGFGDSWLEDGAEPFVLPPPLPRLPPEQNPNRPEYFAVQERRADALVQVVEAFLARPSIASGAVHELLIHVDAEQLGCDDAPVAGILEDGRPLSSAVMQRLACDAAMVAVTRGEPGQALDVGRRTRVVPPAMRRALRIRDHGCRFPGCGQVVGTDAHHIVHWAKGGETKLDNLVLLCRRHHRMVHEEGFAVEQTSPGGFVFCDPRGEVIDETFVREPLSGSGFEEIEAWLRTHGVCIPEFDERERWNGDPLDLAMAVEGMIGVCGG